MKNLLRAALALLFAGSATYVYSAYDGNNTYSLPANTSAVSGQAISSSKFNTLTEDLAAAINDLRYQNLNVSADMLSFLGTANDSAARTALGVAIGTDVQGIDAELTSIAGLTSAADKVPYYTGSGTAALADFTSAGRALMDDANAAAQLTTLGLTANGQSLVTAANYSAMLTLLGLSSADSPTFTDLTTTDDVIVGDDILLGSGAVINWNSGDLLATHSSNYMYWSGGTHQFVYNSTGAPTIYISNLADNASVPVLALDADRATPADGDAAYIDYRLSDDGGTQTVFARQTWTATDVTDTTEDGKLSWSVMKAGTLTEVMTLDSTGLTFSNGAQAPGPTADTTQASTSGTAINFTSIPSTARVIHVTFNGVSLSGTDNILVQIGDSGGLETTGYVSGNATTGFKIKNNNSGDSVSGILTLVHMGSNLWVASGSFTDGSNDDQFAAAGTKTLSATLDRLTVTRDGTNTFDAGSINIVYQ